MTFHSSHVRGKKFYGARFLFLHIFAPKIPNYHMDRLDHSLGAQNASDTTKVVELGDNI
jgi:hypothetical protein